ncbi:DUF6980 family protein [Streptomyces sp. NPDC055897]
MTHHCCEAMNGRVNVRCDQHDDPFACPDALIEFSAKFQEYGLIIHDGGTSSITIYWVPAAFQEDRWLAELPQD